MQVSIGEMAVSADGAWIYLLNLSDGKLHRLDVAKRALDAAAVDLAENSRAMAATPNGKTIYVAAAAGTPNDGMGPPTGAPQGKIQVVDAATFQLKRSMAVDFWPYSIVVTDSGTVFAAGKPRLGPGEIVALDGAKVSRKIDRGSDSSLLRLSPDQKWVYTAPGAFNRFSVSSGKGDLPPNVVPAMMPLEYTGGSYVLSPDGAYQVQNFGAVVKLVKPRKEDANIVAKVVPHLAAAFDADSPKLLCVTTAEGYLKIYSVPNFDLKSSYKLDRPLYRIVLDRKTRVLYGGAHAGDSAALSSGSKGLGGLHLYELSKILEEASKP
jgi:DNA-binding beta-propeller fold protein YncE